MGSGQGRSSNGVKPHSAPEDFLTAAHSQILEAPYWVPGTCFNPACGKPFEPKVPWQIHCSRACKVATNTEMLTWGRRLALPALVWRIGKYESADSAIQDRTRAARRQFTRVQSAWLGERQAREKESRENGSKPSPLSGDGIKASGGSGQT